MGTAHGVISHRRVGASHGRTGTPVAAQGQPLPWPEVREATDHAGFAGGGQVGQGALDRDHRHRVDHHPLRHRQGRVVDDDAAPLARTNCTRAWLEKVTSSTRPPEDSP